MQFAEAREREGKRVHKCYVVQSDALRPWQEQTYDFKLEGAGI